MGKNGIPGRICLGKEVILTLRRLFRKKYSQKSGVGFGEKFPWKELKEIRSLAKVEAKHGSGDFHRMEMILKKPWGKDVEG